MNALLRMTCLACALAAPCLAAADEPMPPVRPTPAQPNPAVPAQPGSTGPSQPIVVRTTDVGARLLVNNPTLVDVLLQGVIDGSGKTPNYDQYALTIYTLGTPAVEKLMPHLVSDDVKRRDAAAQVLTLLMARDDFPLEEVVPLLVELTESDDASRVELGRAMLSHSILFTQSEQRRAMQREIQRLLQGDD